jgi:class 3 adenylate cyclase/tetratricopeptide (TPR) repeat protein
VICSNCGTENRPGRRFCSECGNVLAAACPNCGASNEPTDRFCGNCGTALNEVSQGAAATPATSAAQTERRLVTVLFADLVGFTPFAEDRDAEDVRATLEKYGAIARDVIGRYGGTVEKFIGDAVMAVWGTPVAHEDDAERAVRAGLELVDAVTTLGGAIQARAGVLTGEAAVDLAARDQNLLAGDLVNTAARLQSVAPSGSVLVGDQTKQATESAIAYEPAGDRELKGKSAPVAAWRALRVTAQRGGAGRSETVETPFVGRDEEFRRLREQLPLRGREPRVTLVSVTGPAGIGKSRLAWELEKYVDGVAEIIRWHRGRCPAYGEGVSFWALGEMVRRRASLAEGDDEATTRAGIHAAVEQYVTDPSEREWIESALLSLLAVEPRTQTDTLFAAWRRFFENVAASGPTVLVFEDLHWADAGLLDFIDHLLDWSRNLPLLIVTLSRPELLERRPNWGAGRRSFTALALDPLSDEAMTTMLAAVAPDLDATMLGELVDRADGIPLYAVEFLRMLLADGRLEEKDGRYLATGPLGSLAIPQSLRSLITARLDALPPDDKKLLQDASVIGQSFTQAALEGMSGLAQSNPMENRLRSLARRDLLTFEADARSPERGQYSFTQSLIREVAYSTLAKPERRERHLAAARYLESVGGDETAAVLAGHYLSAYEASADGPEKQTIAAQARVALRGAAERASALGGRKQAAALLAQALAITTDPGEQALLQEQSAVELYHASRYEESEKAIRAAIDLYRSLDDVAGRVRAQAWLGPILIHERKIEQAGRELEAALAELPSDADPAARAEMLAKLSRVEYRLEHNERAIEIADQALAIAEHHRLVRTVADLMTSKGTALASLGRTFEAISLLRGGHELAKQEGDMDTALRAANNLGGNLFNELGARVALNLARESLDLARSVGDVGQTAWQMKNVMLGTLFAADPAEPVLAEAAEVAALDLAKSDRREIVAGLLILKALVGDETSALEAEAKELFDDADDPQTRFDYEFWVQFVPFAAGDFAAAAKHAADATEMAPQFGAMSLAALYALAGGDSDTGRRYEARSTQLPVMGKWDAITRMAARAGVMVMDGERERAIWLFRDALSQMRELEDRLTSSIIGMAMSRTLGADSPDARAAAEQSIADFERMGAPPMIRLVGDVLAASAGAPARSGVTDTVRAAVVTG